MSDNREMIELAGQIVAAYVAHNAVQKNDLPELIQSTYSALGRLGEPQEPVSEQATPAVNPKKSVFPDRIISLIDGKPYKSMKRHLTRHGMTPAQYRTAYGLKPDYPMVAAEYAAKRSELAKSLGLGQKRKVAANDKGAPKSRARVKKAA